MSPRLARALLGSALAALPALAQQPTLARHSPFGGGPTGYAGGVEPASLELCGVMSTADGFQYCIYNPATKQSAWYGVGDEGLGFRVRSGNPQEDEVTLEADGSLLTLKLREARVTGEAATPTVTEPRVSPHGSLLAGSLSRTPGAPRAPQAKPVQ